MIPIKTCMFSNMTFLKIHCRHYRRHNIIIDLFIEHHVDIECDSCPFKAGIDT